MSLNVHAPTLADNERLSAGLTLMLLGMESVTDKNLAEAQFRLAFIERTTKAALAEEMRAARAWLPKMMGVQVNVTTLTRAAWLKNQLRGIVSDVEWDLSKEREAAAAKETK